jgi:hypothetical protein
MNTEKKVELQDVAMIEEMITEGGNTEERKILS